MTYMKVLVLSDLLFIDRYCFSPIDYSSLRLIPWFVMLHMTQPGPWRQEHLLHKRGQGLNYLVCCPDGSFRPGPWATGWIVCKEAGVLTDTLCSSRERKMPVPIPAPEEDAHTPGGHCNKETRVVYVTHRVIGVHSNWEVIQDGTAKFVA